jgi:hypothetical protein
MIGIERIFRGVWVGRDDFTVRVSAKKRRWKLVCEWCWQTFSFFRKMFEEWLSSHFVRVSIPERWLLKNKYSTWTPSPPSVVKMGLTDTRSPTRPVGTTCIILVLNDYCHHIHPTHPTTRNTHTPPHTPTYPANPSTPHAFTTTPPTDTTHIKERQPFVSLECSPTSITKTMQDNLRGNDTQITS